MGLQINEYTNTATALDPLAFFDCDNWTGSAFQSEKVPMSVMESAFTKNIINSNLTQTGNRVQDFAGFTQYWKNNNQLIVESASTPVGGYNFEFKGFGTTSSDNILLVEDNIGNDIIWMKGDRSVSVPSGFLGVGTTAVGAGFGGHRVNVQGGAGGNAINIFNPAINKSCVYSSMGASGSGSSYGFFAQSTNVSGTTIKTGFNADIQGGLENNALSITNGDIKFNSVGGAGSKIGVSDSDKFAFWGSTPLVQQVLATGAGNTVDDVITALQNIGLFKQS